MILGTAQLGMDYGINNTIGIPKEQETFEILKYAYENGIHILDTASAYGKSEECIGFFHSRYKKCFDVCTKLPVDIDKKDGKIKDIIEESIIRSLGVLNVNSMYCCYLHRFEQCKDKSIMEALYNAKHRGLINNIGISIYYPNELCYIVHNLRGIVDIVQLPINIFSIAKWNDELEKAKECNIRIFARSVYLQGLVFKNPQDKKVQLLGAGKYLKRLIELASENNFTISQVCINAIWRMNQINEVIIGCENLQQLSDNLNLIREVVNFDNSLYLSLKELGEEIPDHIIDPSKWSKYING